MWWLTTKPVLNPRADGGAYGYFIETSEKPLAAVLFGSISGDLDLRPDLAILATAGPGNIDADPIQGPLPSSWPGKLNF